MALLSRYQIVGLPHNDPSDGGIWQVGDWADVLQRLDNTSNAEVRWRPGPYNITGELLYEFWGYCQSTSTS